MVHYAKEIMETSVITVAPTDPLESVLRMFVDEGIHGAPVVDDQQEVVGVLSTTDLLRSTADERDGARPGNGYYSEGIASDVILDNMEGIFADRMNGQTVASIMTTELVTVSPGDSAADVAKTMRRHQIHRVIVVEGGQLLGIISTFDLLALLGEDDSA